MKSNLNRWLLLIIIILINYFAWKVPSWQLDLTANRLHSLSPTSRQTIKDLKNDVEIKVFMSEDLPAEVRQLKADLKTILGELQNSNPGKLKLSYVDPIKDDKAGEEAQKYGIQRLQFSSIKSDKFEVQNGYFGLLLKSGEKIDVLPVASDVGNLEYILISGIKKMTADKLTTIAISEDPTKSSQVTYLKKFLERSYNIVNLDLGSSAPFNNEASTLVIIGLGQKIDEKAKINTEEWLKSGKSIVAFVDRVEVNQGLTAQKIEEGSLGKIFENYGIKIEDKLVLDSSSAIANFQSQSGAFVVQYPYWIQILPANIDSSIPALSGLNSLTLPWVSPLIVSDKAKVLFKSSEFSETDDSLTDLAPTTKKSLGNNKSSGFPLAAMRSDEIKLAVVGDADFVKDQFVTNSQQNMGLALNLIDYLSGDSSLLTIRNKTLTANPIIQLNDTQKLLLKSVNVGLPLLILGLIYLTITFKRYKLTQS